MIIYLKRELDINYYKYKIIDVDGNIADILVKKDSDILNLEYLCDMLDYSYLSYSEVIKEKLQ